MNSKNIKDRNSKVILIAILILCLIVSLAFTGCENNGVVKSISKEPEPYTKMLKSINLNDLVLAEKYADLVIHDFPNSDYLYNAYLVKNMIISSKIYLNNIKANYILEGINHMNSMSSQSDCTTIKKYLTDIRSDLENLKNDYESTTVYLLDNYSDSDLIKIELPKAPSDILPVNESDFQGLSWFASVGYPIPTEDEMTSSDNNKIIQLFYELNSGFLADENFSFVSYFYNISGIASNEDFQKRLLNKVIELTESDKYNEFRIQAQDTIKNSN